MQKSGITKKLIPLAATFILAMAVSLLVSGVPVNADAAQLTAEMRINIGGADFTDSEGNLFVADKLYTAGDFGYKGRCCLSDSTSEEIDGTTDDLLYQTMQGNGVFTYRFDVPEGGDYEITMYFVEPYGHGNGGQRIFDVVIEDVVALDDYDITVAAGGKLTAVTETVISNVSDGRLDVDFVIDVLRAPLVSAISVVPVSQNRVELVEAHIEAFNAGDADALNIGDNVLFSAWPFVSPQFGKNKMLQGMFLPLLDRWEISLAETTVQDNLVSGEASVFAGAYGWFSGTGWFLVENDEINGIVYNFDQESRDRIRAILAPPPPPPPPQNATPLMDMTKDDLYLGEDGGLYGDGLNTPPAAHGAAALQELAKIVPLDEGGNPSPDGKIVFTSIGMSNAELKFAVFKGIADDDPEKSSNVAIVNGAQGTVTARSWAKSDFAWGVLEKRMEGANVTAQQVQVVWIEHATKFPFDPFPSESEDLQGYLAEIVQELYQRYPNVKIVYLSSRSYGGYATVSLNAEPHAYESAFAVRWLIQDQIDGNPDLNYDPGQGAVKAPLLIWGPYFWADGLIPRSDGLTWSIDDFLDDGTHPSASGRQKVADILLDFIKTNEYAGN